MATRNKKLALEYQETAARLGGGLTGSSHGKLIDICGGPETSKKRVEIISKLIAKLDPVFASHSTQTPNVRQSGFVSFLTGSVCQLASFIKFFFRNVGKTFSCSSSRGLSQ